MKKGIHILLLLCIVLILSSCGKEDLTNNYFENEEKQTYDDMYQILFENIHRALSNLKLFYPRPYQQSSMYYDDAYVNDRVWDEDQLYRYELYNFLLSDDRRFMAQSHLYYLDDYSILSNDTEECGEILEGEKCLYSYMTRDGNLVKYGLQFFMEGSQLVVDNMYTINQNTLFHYTFYIYENEMNEDVMEMVLRKSNVSQSEYDFISHTTLIFDKSEEVFICNSCDLDDSSTGSLEYIYTDFKQYGYRESPDLEDSNIDSFVHLSMQENHIGGTIYNGETNEVYDVSKNGDVTSTFRYRKLFREMEVVSYSNMLYTVNLNLIDGWDNIRPVPDELNTYQLYYGDTLLSGDERVMLENTESEYVYYNYSLYVRDISVIPDEVIDLSVIGLTTNYSHSFFSDRFEEGVEYFESVLIERSLDFSYSTLYDEFIAKITELDSIQS